MILERTLTVCTIFHLTLLQIISTILAVKIYNHADLILKNHLRFRHLPGILLFPGNEPQGIVHSCLSFGRNKATKT